MDALGNFDSTKASLSDLLREISVGKIQLPDFQRGWVWDDEHVHSLLASVSLSFSIGAVMVLQTGNPSVRFKPRPVEGVRLSGARDPEELILDGQQRLTSLYQALMMSEPVATQDGRRPPLERYYYIDIAKALDPTVDREDAVIGVPPDRIMRNFRSEVILDLSDVLRESIAECLPINVILDVQQLLKWQMAYLQTPSGVIAERLDRWSQISENIIRPFQSYQVPLILLTKATSKEAVCKVFEKVNTGGVSLTVFELLTATYAVDDFNLRDDWELRKAALAKSGSLANVESTDLLQTVTLLSTLGRKRENPLVAIGCKRKDILDLDLEEYRRWIELAMSGYELAARFLFDQRVFKAEDIPYRSQITPLAAILANLGKRASHEGVLAKIRHWYWCGVLGELYGSTIETRFARDVPQVLEWVDGGPEPETVSEASFRPERLRTLRTRNSAAYKGIHALLMREGAADFRSGQTIDSQRYFDDAVEIHHIFPVAWAVKQGLDPGLVDCIVNKTPLSGESNRIIGGWAPSQYLRRLEQSAGISPQRMDELLRTHLIEAQTLRSDDFIGFFHLREEAILDRIERAMEKVIPGRALPGNSSGSVDLEAASVEGAGASLVPPEAKAILLVEGATDEEYLRLAAEICGRSDLLEGLHIEPCGGVNAVIRRAVLLHATKRQPVLALFDRDTNGKAGREALLKRLGFSRHQVLTYGDVLFGNPDMVEAEDMFPPQLMQRFVEVHGETQVLAEKRLHPELHSWHYGLTAFGKEVVADWLRLNAEPADLGNWIRLLELARTHVGLPTKAPEGEGPGPTTRGPAGLVDGASTRSDEIVGEDLAGASAGSTAVESGLDPWRADGQAWHLEQNCSAKTRPIVESLVGIIAEAVPELDGPYWNQRYYVSWKAGGRIWLSMHTRTAWIWLELNEPCRSPEEVAAELKLRFVGPADPVGWTNEGPSQVMGTAAGRAEIQIRRLGDVTGASAEKLVAIIRSSWDQRAQRRDGSAESAGSNDWRRIDAAVAAIPVGRWTSYGDLAELGGTLPIAVGARMGSAPLPLAYRVLDGQGRIRPRFHWVDPSDARDVMEVLKGEGVEFDAAGAASPRQRLMASDLANLLNAKGGG